jgi:hypothetical protein
MKENRDVDMLHYLHYIFDNCYFDYMFCIMNLKYIFCMRCKWKIVLVCFEEKVGLWRFTNQLGEEGWILPPRPF